MCFYNGGSNGLRGILARFLTRRVRFPRLPPNMGFEYVHIGRNCVKLAQAEQVKAPVKFHQFNATLADVVIAAV